MVYWKRLWPVVFVHLSVKYLARVTISAWCESYLESSGQSWDGHDRFQYTIMLLTIRAARFVHHVLVLSPELARYHSRTVKFHPARR